MNSIFEYLISLCLIFLILSTLVSSVLEIYNSVAKKIGKRAEMLNFAILEAFGHFDDYSIGQEVMSHPLLAAGVEDKFKLPSYIEPSVFSEILVQVVSKRAVETNLSYDANGFPVVSRGNKDLIPLMSFKSGLSKLAPGKMKTLLESFVFGVTTTEELRLRIENWFNQYMDRLSGEFKRIVKKNLFWSSLVVVLMLNINAISIMTDLYQDKDLQKELTSLAVDQVKSGIDSFVCDTAIEDSIPCEKQAQHHADKLYTQIKSFDLPIGWNMNADNPIIDFLSWDSINTWFKLFIKSITFHNIFGWLLATVLLMQGAPFWFQLLSKFINLRGTGKKPEKK